MATLIKSESSDGHRRLCSAKCYNAHGTDCTCICNGMNHGVGPQQAAQNTQNLTEELVEIVRDHVSRREAQRLKAQADQLAFKF
ncbi:MAG TPA: hypothetical protein PKZ83_17430 [bacterium]|nr:hypothetical protein [bacterium]HQJ66270.1 hypothetical protein [bacterium]